DRRARKLAWKIDDGHEEVADDEIEMAASEVRAHACPERPRSIFRHGVGHRVEEMPRRIEIKTSRSLGRVIARYDGQFGADLAHAIEICRRRRPVDERQVRQIVMTREVLHHVPGAKLPALVEREQQVRVEPENLHAVACSVDWAAIISALT